MPTSSIPEKPTLALDDNRTDDELVLNTIVTELLHKLVVESRKSLYLS